VYRRSPGIAAPGGRDGNIVVMDGTVLHLLANLDRGGAQEVVRTLVAALPATGWRPVVASFRDGPLRTDIEETGIAVRVLAGRTRSVATPLRATAELRGIRGELRRLVRNAGADVIQTHLLGSLDFVALAARTRRQAVLWTVHNALVDLRPDQLPGGQRWLLGGKRAGYRLAYRLGGRLADGFVAVSDDVAAAVTAAYHPPRERLFVIPNGVEVERYGSREGVAATRGELGLAPDGRLLIVVAKLFAQKGHAVLLDALAATALRPDDRVLLVGEGPEREGLELAVRHRGLAQVRFAGNRPDVPALLAASDLFVLPSLWEGLPMALLEAMASGLPVIATDVAGSRQVVVPGESGILVPPGDAAALAGAMGELLADEAQRARLGRDARLRVEGEFSSARQAERHAAAYQAVLARRQRE
jgi:glycosyltransferase involved in cell wall biosynthesis